MASVIAGLFNQAAGNHVPTITFKTIRHCVSRKTLHKNKSKRWACRTRAAVSCACRFPNLSPPASSWLFFFRAKLWLKNIYKRSTEEFNKKKNKSKEKDRDRLSYANHYHHHFTLNLRDERISLKNPRWQLSRWSIFRGILDPGRGFQCGHLHSKLHTKTAKSRPETNFYGFVLQKLWMSWTGKTANCSRLPWLRRKVKNRRGKVESAMLALRHRSCASQIFVSNFSFLGGEHAYLRS